jgi:hypothetical protein
MQHYADKFLIGLPTINKLLSVMLPYVSDKSVPQYLFNIFTSLGNSETIKFQDGTYLEFIIALIRSIYETRSMSLASIARQKREFKLRFLLDYLANRPTPNIEKYFHYVLLPSIELVMASHIGDTAGRKHNKGLTVVRRILGKEMPNQIVAENDTNSDEEFLYPGYIFSPIESFFGQTENSDDWNDSF